MTDEYGRGVAHPTARCSTRRAPKPGDIALAGDENAVAAQVTAPGGKAGVTDFVAAEYSRGDEAVGTRALLKSLLG